VTVLSGIYGRFDSNSNRNARFDSYSIRMQTADSQVPTLRSRKKGRRGKRGDRGGGEGRDDPPTYLAMLEALLNMFKNKLDRQLRENWRLNKFCKLSAVWPPRPRATAHGGVW